MATALPNFGVLLTFVSILFISSIQYGATAKFKSPKPQFTNFKLYWHDVVGGAKPTSVTIIKPVANQSTSFGSVQMIDNPLTRGPSLKSKELGRAQGLYGGDSLEKLSLIMMMNFVFTTGKYNGSTITIIGSNSVFDKVREMSVVGGTGVFGLAHGYALAQTHSFSATEAVVLYNVSVMH